MSDTAAAMTTSDLYAALSGLFPDRFTVTPYSDGWLIMVARGRAEPDEPPAAATAGEVEIRQAMPIHRFVPPTRPPTLVEGSMHQRIEELERDVAELVAALERIASRVPPHPDWEACSCAWCNAVRTARAAINKATARGAKS